MNHIIIKKLRKKWGLTGLEAAHLVGWQSADVWYRLEYDPETSTQARTASPSLQRLLILIDHYHNRNGKLPNFAVLDKNLKKRLD